MVNTPIPHSLKSEAKKAAKILSDFSMPSTKVGPDKLIPAGVLMEAAGLAILSVVRVGFLVTARGGSGIVIAKLDDGSWSAPSAIGIAGLGGGFEVGAEVTDFVIILNKRSAVQAFSKGGNLTLGGNFTIAAGPVGRNVEGDVSIRSPAAIYTYSKTKGLFAGISIEGSYLIERKDANKKFYKEEIRAYDILSGKIDPPGNCSILYEVLDKHADMYERVKERAAKKEEEKEKKRQENQQWASQRSRSTKATPIYRKKGSVSDKKRRQSEGDAHNSNWYVYEAEDTADSGAPQGGSTTVRALWSFTAVLSCDLSFSAGEVFEVLTKTSSQDDWWEGRLSSGKVGIFPANYVMLI